MAATREFSSSPQNSSATHTAEPGTFTAPPRHRCRPAGGSFLNNINISKTAWEFYDSERIQNDGYRRLRKEDDDMKKDYVEEIDSLLIFAGLFSAVLTAFIVEVYKDLEEDTSATSAQLLRRMSLQLEFGPTAHELEPLPSAYHPSHTLIAVNILWFSSLMLSLFTALFGIFIKQWLRVYNRWAEQWARDDPDKVVMLRAFYYQNFKNWRVPDILALLPVLLQVALLCFAVGLIAFLWTVNSIVASVLSSLIVILLSLTVVIIILPIFYAGCPYKSPLGWMLAPSGSSAAIALWKVKEWSMRLFSQIHITTCDLESQIIPVLRHVDGARDWTARDRITLQSLATGKSTSDYVKTVLEISTLTTQWSSHELATRYINQIHPDVLSLVLDKIIRTLDEWPTHTDREFIIQLTWLISHRDSRIRCVVLYIYMRIIEDFAMRQTLTSPDHQFLWRIAFYVHQLSLQISSHHSGLPDFMTSDEAFEYFLLLGDSAHTLDKRHDPGPLDIGHTILMAIKELCGIDTENSTYASEFEVLADKIYSRAFAGEDETDTSSSNDPAIPAEDSSNLQFI